jgi:probable F420-dependent oxidoreductase
MNRPFRFGVVTAYAQSRDAWITTARRAENLGYATLLMPDRVNMGGPAPLTALAVAAEATSTLRVGSYVFCNDYRHPVLLAREAATLDLLSAGRFELGLGAGVGPADLQQLGLPVASAGACFGHLEESLQIIKRLFTQETVDFTGKYYTITAMKGYPRPAQQPHMPILVAGTGERMLKLAAREANIVAIGAKFTPPGSGAEPTDATLEQKIAWIKEAAGPRFADLELCQTIYHMGITDSGKALSTQAGGPPIPKRPMSISQAVDDLLEQRERYGFSYLQVYDAQMENFAPVVARLAGH